MDEMTLTLNSPITEEQWDAITDVDFEHTNEITFHTKHGKEVKFVKASARLEQRWIPCGERMPEEHEWIGTKKFGTTISNEVYVTFETPDGERFTKHISFQNGKLSRVDKQQMEVWYKGAKPIAWKPLPEPYREDE